MIFSKPHSVVIMLSAFLFLAGGLYAQTRFSIDAGLGSSFISEDGVSFGLFLEPKFGFTPAFMIGNKSAAHFSTDKIFSLETQCFVRWNFLRFGSLFNTTNIFIQGGIGFISLFHDIDLKESRATLLADATVGVTIPLGKNWHIEPSIRGGYPFMAGVTVLAGKSIPIRRRLLGPGIETPPEVLRKEVIEIIEFIPNELIRRFMVTQVEYVIFDSDNLSFNEGLDLDAQSLNTLVLDQTAKILLENPSFRVRIEGHANPVTNAPEEAQELIDISMQRSNEVARQLMEKGVQEEQIVVIGYGGARVIAATEDHDHWNMNRRVELIIVRFNLD